MSINVKDFLSGMVRKTQYGNLATLGNVGDQPTTDLLLSMNYIGRPWFAAAALLGATRATAASLSEAGEYDLVLRCTERATSIHHLPMLLCQRGVPELDSAAQERAAPCWSACLDRRCPDARGSRDRGAW